VSLEILLLGPPGAGKGTQAKLIESAHGIPQISTGDILRDAVSSGSDLGQRVGPIMASGDLVPDELMVEVIRDRLARPDAEAGFILDGFPRTLPQAVALDEMLASIGRPLRLVLEFDVSEDACANRLVGRAEDEGRKDDDPEVVRHRLRVWRESTRPVSDYYRERDVIVRIAADRPVEQVGAKIESVINASNP